MRGAFKTKIERLATEALENRLVGDVAVGPRLVDGLLVDDGTSASGLTSLYLRACRAHDLPFAGALLKEIHPNKPTADVFFIPVLFSVTCTSIGPFSSDSSSCHDG